MPKSASNSSTNSTMETALHAPAEMVQEYPLSTALVVFGVGLGIGALLSQTVCDSFAFMTQPKPTMSERLSRQLYDTFSQAVPDSLSRRFTA